MWRRVIVDHAVSGDYEKIVVFWWRCEWYEDNLDRCQEMERPARATLLVVDPSSEFGDVRYEVNLLGQIGFRHFVRFITARDRTTPLLHPELTQILDIFKELGWEVAVEHDFRDWYEYQGSTVTRYTLTPGPESDPLEHAHIPGGFGMALIEAGQARLAAKRAEEKHRWMTAWRSCAFIQEVAWGIEEDGRLRFLREDLTREVGGVSHPEFPHHIYRLSNPTRHEGGFRAELYRYSRARYGEARYDLERGDVSLAGEGGNRPTRHDPPAAHLNAELGDLLAEAAEYGWQVAETSITETEEYGILRCTITTRLARAVED